MLKNRLVYIEIPFIFLCFYQINALEINRNHFLLTRFWFPSTWFFLEKLAFIFVVPSAL